MKGERIGHVDAAFNYMWENPGILVEESEKYLFRMSIVGLEFAKLADYEPDHDLSFIPYSPENISSNILLKPSLSFYKYVAPDPDELQVDSELKEVVNEFCRDREKITKLLKLFTKSLDRRYKRS